MSQSAEELEGAHHQNEIGQPSVLIFDLVSNKGEDEQEKRDDQEWEIHELHVYIADADALVSPEFRHVTFRTFAEALVVVRNVFRQCFQNDL